MERIQSNTPFQSDGLVPEPSTFILLGLGSAGLGFVAYKHRKGVA